MLQIGNKTVNIINIVQRDLYMILNPAVSQFKVCPAKPMYPACFPNRLSLLSLDLAL
jgi:hypothetical protein